MRDDRHRPAALMRQSRISSITFRPVCESSAAVGSSARMTRDPGQSPRNRHALLLSAAQVRGKRVVLVGEADLVEQSLRSCAPRAAKPFRSSAARRFHAR